MRVRTFAGLKTLLGLGPQIDKAGTQRPEGLLHYENHIIFMLYPLHLGMRWYWRDFESASDRRPLMFPAPLQDRVCGDQRAFATTELILPKYPYRQAR